MGLDHIFKLTNRYDVRTQLKIILERFSGEIETVLYDDFSLQDQMKYRLKFGDFHGKENLDNLRMSMVNGVGFSTKDHDNDWKINKHCQRFQCNAVQYTTSCVSGFP